MAEDRTSILRNLRRAIWRGRVAVSRFISPNGLQLVAAQRQIQAQAAPTIREWKREADELWNRGSRNEALDRLREGTLEAGGDTLWWPLYNRLQAMGRFDAASFALRNAVQVAPQNLDALEMLIEDAALRGPNNVVTRAFERLPKMLSSLPTKHLHALFFVLPARHEPSLEALEHSPNPVVAEVIEIYRRWAETDESMLEDASPLATAIFAMSVGKHSIARDALRRLPNEDFPIAGVRITVRRLLRDKKKKAAHEYLRLMSPLVPSDGWVRKQLVATGEGILTPYQLSRSGYPFPKKRSRPTYDPKVSTSLYLLHNSLPYHSAGYATRTHGLLSAMHSLGWDVRGVTRIGYPYDMPKYKELADIDAVDVVDGIPYHRLSVHNQLELKKPIQLYVDRYETQLRELALARRPFVIHAASNHWNGLAAVQTANRLGVHSIYEVRGLWEVTRGSRDPEWAKGGMFRYMARLEADAAMGATRVIAITQALKDELISRGVDGEKISVVPNGVNSDRFQPKPRNEALAARLGVAGRAVIGYVGSVLDYEGLGLLIDAAQQLKAEGRQFAVLIVGDGAELELYQSEAEERDLADVVIFTGRVPHEEVEEYYSVIDICPFPRLPLPVCEMVSPLKPFEAMAMQKAVVASDVAALAEIVDHGVTGLLHTKGDARHLKEQLALLLDSPQLRDRLALAGRTWVLQERQWNQLGKSVESLYRELGGSPVTA